MENPVTKRITRLGDESRQLLSLIQKAGPITKSVMAQECGFTIPSVKRYLKPLMAEKLVKACGTDESGGGRRPTLFAVCGDAVYGIGVNLASMYMEIRIVDFAIRLVAKRRFDGSIQDAPDHILPQLWSAIAEMIEEEGLDKNQIAGIGLSVFGRFDRATNSIQKSIAISHDPAWTTYPIVAVFEELSGLPVRADIGSNNAAVAEYLFGYGRGHDKLLGVRIGKTIKTACIASGSIVRTNNNMEEAFGHMTIDITGPQCACGNYGCLECYAAIPAIMKTFAFEVKKGRAHSIPKPLEDITFQDVLAAADQGDSLPAAVVSNAATMMGIGLANYINLIDPDIVTMDSLVVRNSELYFTTAVDVARRRSSFLNPDSKTRFVRDSKFEDATTVGAAVMALESLVFGRQM